MEENGLHLRTIDEINGEQVLRWKKFPLNIDWRTASGSDSELRREMQECHDLAFDLNSGPLVRVHCFTHSGHMTDILFVTHHVVFDQESGHIVLSQFCRILKWKMEGESLN